MTGQWWNERAGAFWGKAGRYLRLIGNSGFMFALYILLFAGAVFYPAFLDWLPQSPWVVVALWLIFSVLTLRGPIRPFVQSGDLVFLLPLEKRMVPFFKKSIRYSAALQGVEVLTVYIVLGPVIQERTAAGGAGYIGMLLLLLVITFLTTFIKWEEWKWHNHTHRYISTAVRWVWPALLMLAAWWGSIFLAGAGLLGLIGHWQLVKRRSASMLLRWEVLLEAENHQLAKFYRFVQSFAEVPHIEVKIKRRRWLASLVDKFSHKQENTYLYLYGKAFVRSGEYAGMFMRLLVVCGLIMYAFAPEWMRLGIGGLFLYMTAVQLQALKSHYATIDWPDLYPVPAKWKEQAFITFTRALLMVQGAGIVLLHAWIGQSLLVTAALILFVALLLLYYPRWVTRRKQKEMV
ncbi:ABC-2 type transport system permease protein [Marinococcus luteus]|uniref:ABC-2 type transport system permease protein n=1 Tax=Marinococcus luteus TaxID=1122204 RepID=A0A1H2S8X8_9BACI|nr:ABC transporter permease [Marinococcus luteus]SDW28123.1 ABC-2 type transport system permease protein [Marinococcus luteus]